MARVKRSVSGKKHRRAILEEAQGYTGARSRHYRKANEQVMHSLRYAYRDRRARKGEFRRLWIVRINAACREHEMSLLAVHGRPEGGRRRRRPQDPRRPRGARARDVRRIGRDRPWRARRGLTFTESPLTPKSLGCARCCATSTLATGKACSSPKGRVSWRRHSTTTRRCPSCTSGAGHTVGQHSHVVARAEAAGVAVRTLMPARWATRVRRSRSSRSSGWNARASTFWRVLR